MLAASEQVEETGSLGALTSSSLFLQDLRMLFLEVAVRHQNLRCLVKTGRARMGLSS
jgi:hypothetical protein